MWRSRLRLVRWFALAFLLMGVASVKEAQGVIHWQHSAASWYGPGLYGNRTACGQTLTPGLRGVAHKSLRCGTRLRICYHGRCVYARVVDRGPFIPGRTFDLTAATRYQLGFPNGVATVRWRTP